MCDDRRRSQLDSSTGMLYALVRHEDEPTSLPAKVFTFDLSADLGAVRTTLRLTCVLLLTGARRLRRSLLARHLNAGKCRARVICALICSCLLPWEQATSVDTDPAFVFSSFVVDARGGDCCMLFAMSPGPVDDNGDALAPVWQLVSIDARCAVQPQCTKASRDSRGFWCAPQAVKCQASCPQAVKCKSLVSAHSCPWPCH